MTVAEHHGLRSLTWANRDKEATRWSYIGLAFCLGIVANSAYYGIPHLWDQSAKLQHVEKVVVPELKKTAAKAKSDKAALCEAIAQNAPEQVPVDGKCPDGWVLPVK